MNVALPLIIGRGTGAMGVPINEVKVLSIGTGVSYAKIEGAELDWGFYQWSSKIISLMFDAQQLNANNSCEIILGDHYHRISPEIDKSKFMDDITAIPTFKELANKMNLSDTIDWIKSNWR
jgi:hypothetical protein